MERWFYTFCMIGLISLIANLLTPDEKNKLFCVTGAITIVSLLLAFITLILLIQSEGY
jgi:hypothetical protein